MADNDFDRSALQQVIAVINGKGGIGKTTIVANCGALLAASGWRVLLVDLDPQGDLGLDLGYADTDRDDDGEDLARALSYGGAPTPLRDVRPGLDVLVGGPRIERAANSIMPEFARAGDEGKAARLSLARTLAHIADDYDMILIDSPPNDEVLQSLAVVAARYIVVPAKTDKASVRGLKQVERRMDHVLDVNPDVDLLGVVIFGTMPNATRIRESFIEMAGEELGAGADDIVFQSYISNSELTAQHARQKGLLAHEIDAKVRSADAPKWYEALRLGKKVESPGPQASKNVADNLQALTQEIVSRFTNGGVAPESADIETETEGAAHV